MPIGLAAQLALMAARGGRQCAVPGCTRLVRLGRWCQPHQQRAKLHGTPTATPLRKSRLKFYRKRVKAWLKVNGEHPAVQIVVNQYDDMLEEALRIARGAYVRRADSRQKVLLELARLRRQGVQGFDVLEEVLCVHALAESEVATVPTYSRQHRFACARMVLLIRQHPGRDASGITARTYVGAQALDYLGEKVQKICAVLADEMVKSWRQADERSAEIREGIRNALEQDPLKPVPEPPAPHRPLANEKPQAASAPLAPTRGSVETLPDGTTIYRY